MQSRIRDIRVLRGVFVFFTTGLATLRRLVVVVARFDLRATFFFLGATLALALALALAAGFLVAAAVPVFFAAVFVLVAGFFAAAVLAAAVAFR